MNTIKIDKKTDIMFFVESPFNQVPVLLGANENCIVESQHNKIYKLSCKNLLAKLKNARAFCYLILPNDLF